MSRKTGVRKRLIDGAVWGFASKLIALSAALVTTMLLARMITPAEMGVYFLAASVIKVTSIVGQFGLGRVAVRRVSEALAVRGRAAAARIGINVIRFGVLGALLVVLAMYQWIIPWVSQHLPAAGALDGIRLQVAVWSLAIVAIALVSQVQRGFHHMRLSSILGSATGPTLIVTFYLVILYLGRQATLDIVTTAAAAASVVTFLVAFAFLRPSLRDPEHSQAGGVQRMYTDAWPFWLASVGSLIFAQADLWIIAAFLTAEDVAHYGAALRLLVLTALPTAVISAVMQSTISDLHARGDSARLEQVLRMSNIFASLPSMALLVIFMVLPDLFLTTVYGDAYASGAMVLAILSVGDLTAAAFGMPALVLRMMDRERVVMNSILVTGALTIAAALAGARWYGTMGVATAIAFGTIIQRAYLWRQTRQQVRIRTDVFALCRADFSRAWGVAATQFLKIPGRRGS